MNKVMLIGNLTRDPETKGSVTKFMVAVNKKDGATFVPCAAFGKTGEIIAKYLKKGSQAGFEGEFTAKKVEDKIYYGVTIDRVTFMGKKDSSGDSGEKPDTSNTEDENPFL